MKIYLSGKISGTDLKETSEKFKTYQKHFEKLEHEVVNPFELTTDLTLDWCTYMKTDIKAMLDCDTIFVMNDYIDSIGAKLEFHIAVMLGYPIIRQWNIEI